MTEQELEKIINRYSRLLWSVASKILNGIGNEQDVEECVADVFIDLWRDPNSYDTSRGSMKTFLALKCRNKSIDRFRRLSAHIADELSEEQISELPEPFAKIAQSELHEELFNALARLEDPDREITIRRFFLQQKPSQISSIMQLSVRKVENIIYRAKGKLREELRGIYE